MAATLRKETLEFYVELTTNILIEVAQGKRETKLISYSELMDEMGGPGRGYIARYFRRGEYCRRVEYCLEEGKRRKAYCHYNL